ncbi:hypothetical protein EDB85DRAFT_2272685 [Lactarius pseudohatsudake]|nr:hypothetical protein EDB85DRAFT_2272685 [Lactarius pseudohatsudake]
MHTASFLRLSLGTGISGARGSESEPTLVKRADPVGVDGSILRLGVWDTVRESRQGDGRNKPFPPSGTNIFRATNNDIILCAGDAGPMSSIPTEADSGWSRDGITKFTFPSSRFPQSHPCTDRLEVTFPESYVAVTSYGSMPTLVSSQEKAPSTATWPDITHGMGRCKSFSSPDITFAVFASRLGRIGRCNAEGVRMILELSSTFTISDKLRPISMRQCAGPSFKNQALLAKNVMPSRIDRKPTGVDRSCCMPRQKLFRLLEDTQKRAVLRCDKYYCTPYITASTTTKLKVRTTWTWGDWIPS